LVCKKSIPLVLAAMLMAAVMAKQAMAEVIQIEFTQFDTFSIDVANIGVGDTVEWLPKNKGHNVEFLAGPDMADLPAKSNMNEFHSVLFERPGVYLYGCTPHLNMGMLGLVVVGNDLHNINEIGNTDLPNVAKSVLMSLIRDAQSSAKSN
jgi:pseudoazurin